MNIMDKFVYSILLFCPVLFMLPVVQLRPNSDCLTPLDENGICINIVGCPLLNSLFENGKKNESVALFLTQSFCGYDNRYPKVCCPLDDEESFIRTLEDDILETPEIVTLSIEDSVLSKYNTNAAVSTAKLPPPSECGRPNITISRIKGGLNVELGALPWMAALGYSAKSKPKHYVWECGGALISNRHVLTAAHCINSRLAIVRLGDLDLDPNMKDGAEPISVTIEQIMKHEHYNHNEITNDIALLKLTKSVSFGKFIQPICLPILPEMRSKMLVNLMPIVAGWGTKSFRGPMSSALLEIHIPIQNISKCKQAFSNHGISVDDHQVICAGEMEGGKDSCQGDSGSPLMWVNVNQYYMIGLVSFGFRCGERGYPGVYTKVSTYVEWIEDKINTN